MIRMKICLPWFSLTAAALAIMAATATAQSPAPAARLDPARMPLVTTIDERFQSYNIEMVEVTGGRFWAPYKQAASGPTAVEDKAANGNPAGMKASLYRYRTPIDLTNPKLRMLARALSPAYMRVSGTWANTTFFQDTDATEPGKAPEGFGGVLTRAEWKNVIDFSKAIDARLVTSFAIGMGVRDAHEVWTPDLAAKWLHYTKSIGGSIALAEFFNEPNLAIMGGAPKDYTAEAYGRDMKIFHDFLKKESPETRLIGPSSLGENSLLEQQPAELKHLRSVDMLTAEGPLLDGYSYHFYGDVSRRCKKPGEEARPERALDATWLTKTDKDEAYYASLRDRFAPGKPIYLSETGETACGGNPWASSFADTFRYLRQLGSMAHAGVQAVMHNTLAASDYALIDEATLTPRPSYWGAVLWNRTMGTKVLEAGQPASANEYVYAHCLKGHAGGVAVLAINADTKKALSLELPVNSTRYTLTSTDVFSSNVQLNGKEVQLTPGGDLPELKGVNQARGTAELPAASITFFAIPDAHNAVCR
jgi:hypothetical protein